VDKNARTILIVDSDRRSRRVLEVSLKKAGYRSVGVEAARDAQKELQERTVDLIIADTDLPDISGFDFCRSVKSIPELETIPFIFLTYSKDMQDKLKGYELGVDDYISKPVFVKEIASRVAMLLVRHEREAAAEAQAQTVEGELSDFGLVEIMQTLEDGRRTGALRLEKSGRRGTIYFDQGVPIDAKVQLLMGDEAVYRLLGWNTGAYTIKYLSSISRSRRIKGSFTDLILEGLHRLERWDELSEQFSAFDRTFCVEYAKLAGVLDNLSSESQSLIRLFDGRRTAGQVVEDSEVGDLKVLELIIDLASQGVLQETAPAVLEDDDDFGDLDSRDNESFDRWMATESSNEQREREARDRERKVAEARLQHELAELQILRDTEATALRDAEERYRVAEARMRTAKGQEQAAQEQLAAAAARATETERRERQIQGILSGEDESVTPDIKGGSSTADFPAMFTPAADTSSEQLRMTTADVMAIPDFDSQPPAPSIGDAQRDIQELRLTIEREMRHVDEALEQDEPRPFPQLSWESSGESAPISGSERDEIDEERRGLEDERAALLRREAAELIQSTSETLKPAPHLFRPNAFDFDDKQRLDAEEERQLMAVEKARRFSLKAAEQAEAAALPAKSPEREPLRPPLDSLLSDVEDSGIQALQGSDSTVRPRVVIESGDLAAQIHDALFTGPTSESGSPSTVDPSNRSGEISGRLPVSARSTPGAFGDEFDEFFKRDDDDLYAALYSDDTQGPSRSAVPWILGGATAILLLAILLVAQPFDSTEEIPGDDELLTSVDEEELLEEELTEHTPVEDEVEPSYEPSAEEVGVSVDTARLTLEASVPLIALVESEAIEMTEVPFRDIEEEEETEEQRAAREERSLARAARRELERAERGAREEEDRRAREREERAEREAEEEAEREREEVEAIAEAETGTEAESSSGAAGDLDVARDLYDSDSYRAAASELRAFLETEPRNGEALLMLGSSLYELEDTREAVRYLQRATRANRRNSQALLLLGSAQQEIRDNSGARETYERYLELNPDGSSADEIRRILEQL
jgi:CheY-like chemotaxis protein/TolA-binding protein